MYLQIWLFSPIWLFFCWVYFIMVIHQTKAAFMKIIKKSIWFLVSWQRYVRHGGRAPCAHVGLVVRCGGLLLSKILPVLLVGLNAGSLGLVERGGLHRFFDRLLVVFILVLFTLCLLLREYDIFVFCLSYTGLHVSFVPRLQAPHFVYLVLQLLDMRLAVPIYVALLLLEQFLLYFFVVNADNLFLY